MFSQRYTFIATFGMVLVVVLMGLLCSAQSDYDDDNYGNQGNNNNQGGYGNDEGGYGNDDGYSGNQPNYNQNVDSDGSNNNPSSYQPQGGSDADGDYEGDDGSAAAAAASAVEPSVIRVRRSTDSISEAGTQKTLSRVKRHGKYYIGPVYTYVKTDKHANFKWGVKHKVGKKHHG